MATKTEKYKGIANPRYAREMHELRSSGAAGTHADRRTRRERARSAQTRSAVSRNMREH